MVQTDTGALWASAGAICGKKLIGFHSCLECGLVSFGLFFPSHYVISCSLKKKQHVYSKQYLNSVDLARQDIYCFPTLDSLLM